MASSSGDERLIERELPCVETINEEAKREKSGRYPIFELQFWWARKPLVVSRAVILGSLLSARDREKFIEVMIKNDKDKRRVATAEKRITHDILELAKDKVILDPFGGGGSIPFEGLNLGLKVITNDYNPVAWALLKALDLKEELVNVKEWKRISKNYRRSFSVDMEALCTKEDTSKLGKLIDSGCKVILGVKKKNEGMFPHLNGRRVAAYLWVRETECPNCGAKIPLTSNWYLRRGKRGGKKTKRPPLYYSIHYEGEDYTVEIKEGNPQVPPVKDKGKDVVCPKCGYAIKEKTLVENIKKDPNKARLIVTMTEDKEFHLARKEDAKLPEVDNSPINTEVIHDKVVSASRYGFSNYAEMFNKRQLKVISDLIEEIKTQVPTDEKMVRLYLSFLVSKHSDYNSSLTTWNSSMVKVSDTMAFRRPSMTWNFVEVNPFSLFSGSLWSMFYNVIEACAFVEENVPPSHDYSLFMESAEDLPIPEGSVDMIVTDPPYYDDVQYAEISDFFYALIKPVLHDVFPDKFSFSSLWRERSMQEMSVGPGRDGSFFEMKFKTVLNSMKRYLKDDGVISLFYAHKNPKFWISVLQSIFDSGFIVNNAIPLHTEQETSSTARGKVAMQSSIVLVLKKRKEGEERVVFVEDLTPSIEREIYSSLKEAIDNGYRGADILLAGLGASLRIATQYSKLSSKRKDAKPFESIIDMVYEVAPTQVLNLMIHGDASTFDAVTKFYLFAKISGIYSNEKAKNITISNDEAIKLTRGFGEISLEDLKRDGLIKRSEKGEALQLLNFKSRTKYNNKENIAITAYQHLLKLFEEGGKKVVEGEITSNMYTFPPSMLCSIAEILATYGPEDDEKKVSKEYLRQMCNKRVEESQATLDKFYK